MKTLTSVVIGGLLGSTAFAEEQMNLLSNGSFEKGLFQIKTVSTPAYAFWDNVAIGETRIESWVIGLSPNDPDQIATEAGMEWFAQPPTADALPNGDVALDLVAGTDFYKVSTSCLTVAGKRYLLSFWVSSGGVLKVRASGTTTRVDTNLPVTEDGVWRQIKLSFTADSETTKFEFWAVQGGASSPGSGPALDAVRVVPIEEPSLDVEVYAGMQVRGTPGKQYRIDYSHRVNGDWQALTTITLPSTPYFFVDDSVPARVSKRFYRAVELE